MYCIELKGKHVYEFDSESSFKPDTDSCIDTEGKNDSLLANVAVELSIVYVKALSV